MSHVALRKYLSIRNIKYLSYKFRDPTKEMVVTYTNTCPKAITKHDFDGVVLFVMGFT